MILISLLRLPAYAIAKSQRGTSRRVIKTYVRAQSAHIIVPCSSSVEQHHRFTKVFAHDSVVCNYFVVALASPSLSRLEGEF